MEELLKGEKKRKKKVELKNIYKKKNVEIEGKKRKCMIGNGREEEMKNRKNTESKKRLRKIWKEEREYREKRTRKKRKIYRKGGEKGGSKNIEKILEERKDKEKNWKGERKYGEKLTKKKKDRE